MVFDWGQVKLTFLKPPRMWIFESASTTRVLEAFSMAFGFVSVGSSGGPRGSECDYRAWFFCGKEKLACNIFMMRFGGMG